MELVADLIVCGYVCRYYPSYSTFIHLRHALSVCSAAVFYLSAICLPLSFSRSPSLSICLSFYPCLPTYALSRFSLRFFSLSVCLSVTTRLSLSFRLSVWLPGCQSAAPLSVSAPLRPHPPFLDSLPLSPWVCSSFERHLPRTYVFPSHGIPDTFPLAAIDHRFGFACSKFCQSKLPLCLFNRGKNNNKWFKVNFSCSRSLNMHQSWEMCEDLVQTTSNPGEARGCPVKQW